MNEIKLVAFDLDGTTVDMGGTVPTDRFCRCVAEGSRRGVVFAPFTGRSVTTVPPRIMEMPSTRYIAYSNGAGIFDAVTDSCIYAELMPMDTCLTVLRYLEPYDLPVMVFSNGRIIMDSRTRDDPGRYPLPPHHKKALEGGTTIITESIERYITENKPNVDKINIVRVLGEPREKICADLAENDLIHVVSSGGVNLEINGINTNKGNALRFLAEHLGIDLKNVMAIGDNDNDAEMLEAAGLGVVVANGSDLAKAAADATTEAQSEDGAAAAIERFILNGCAVTL